MEVWEPWDARWLPESHNLYFPKRGGSSGQRVPFEEAADRGDLTPSEMAAGNYSGRHASVAAFARGWRELPDAGRAIGKHRRRRLGV